MANPLAKQSSLYIYSDGAKPGADPAVLENIRAVRKIIREKKWCREVNIIESGENKGLAQSITDGVSSILEQFDRLIVLEDDLVLSPGFLDFMNEALALYQDQPEVMHISGYMPPVKARLGDTFFLRAATCWGWATWKRSWSKYIADADYWMDRLQDPKVLTAFNWDNSCPDLYEQLRLNAAGKMRTWAIKWYATIFFEKGLSLHPGTSLVQNIGHDSSGIHSDSTNAYYIPAVADHIRVQKIPLEEDQEARQAVYQFYRSMQPGFMDKAKEKLSLLKNKFR